MMDDISLEDVEQFEEARLAQVRRKVSRVESLKSLKKFLFSSRLEEKKTRNHSGRQWQGVLSQPVRTTMDSGTALFSLYALSMHISRREGCKISKLK